MMAAEQVSDRKTQADFMCMKFKLDAECSLFQSHQLALKEWEHTTASSRAERLQQLDDLVETTTKDHCDVRFPMLLVEEKDEAVSNKLCRISIPTLGSIVVTLCPQPLPPPRWRFSCTLPATASRKKRPP